VTANFVSMHFELQSIVGTLQSINDCVLAVRLHTNGLIEDLNAAAESHDGKVTPSERALENHD